MAVDQSMRKLKIPAKFLPYLEKHRIYETFCTLAEMLVMTKPHDHVCFLKNAIQDVCRMRDDPKIVLIAPPQLDKLNIARIIANKTGVRLLCRHVVCKDSGIIYDAVHLAQKTAEAVYLKDNLNKNGWILIDYPDTAEEAKQLLKQGILPTHTFLFLPSDNFEHLKSCEMPEWDYKELEVAFEEYKRNSVNLKYLYRTTLKKINTTGKTIKQIGDMCCAVILKKPPHRGAPTLWRAVLIGLRGSGRRTIAKMLSQQYGLVHVDMEEIINQARAREDRLGDELRSMEQHGIPIYPSVFLQLLKDRLLEDDCLNHGYVLTNFPRDVADFQMLDSYDARPNRIIYLKVSSEECLERIKDRCVNMYTGEVLSRKTIEGNKLLEKQVMSHPDDEICRVTTDHEIVNEATIQEIIVYCGTDCSTVDALNSLSAVYERVQSVLMNALPSVVPRSDEQPQAKLAEQILHSKQPAEAEFNDEINIDKMYRKFLQLKRTEYPGPNDPVKVTDLLEELSFDSRWEILEKYRLSQLVFNGDDKKTEEIFKRDDVGTIDSDD